MTTFHDLLDEPPRASRGELTPTVSVGLYGERFELSRDLVIERLRGRLPGEISVHWVEIEGVRWPVMQAMGIALGTSPSFRSKHARRYFARLAFALSQKSGRRNVRTQRLDSGDRVRADSDPFDLGAAPELETIDISLNLTWRLAGQVALDPAGHPIFPPLPDEPGLYRFDFGADETGRSRWYIGETKNLRNRAGQYRAAKGDRRRPLTSRRLHLLMVDRLSVGGTIAMAVATEVTLTDGSTVNIGRKSGRLLGESAAVVLAQRDPNVVVLNRDDELVQDALDVGEAQL